MALQHPTYLSSSSHRRHHNLGCFHGRRRRSSSSSQQIHTARFSSSSGRNENEQEELTTTSPAEQFAPLASTFRRRLLTGVGTASLVAVGANFGGVTSFLLGLSPETGRNLKLDVLYPIKDYIRCVQPDQGFEFIYPANWVGDQTLVYRAAKKAEQDRAASLDLPPLNNRRSSSASNTNEPVVAFGPPGSSGELNVSVVVSQVPPDFTIEAFGGPEEVGRMIIQAVTRRRRTTDVKGTLTKATRKEGEDSKVGYYYQVEFKVEGPTFQRHNIAVCCVRGTRLYTLNAQAPELIWPQVEKELYMIADSFKLSGVGGAAG